MTLAKGARQLVVHDALLGVKKKCHRLHEVKLKLVKCSLEELTIVSSCVRVHISRYRARGEVWRARKKLKSCLSL